MSEIKFRAWVENGTKLIPSPIVHIDSYGEITLPYPDKTYVNPIIEQFTGLHDKNGKEIYEGDVILCFDEIKAIVVWNESTSAFMLDYQPEHDDGSGQLQSLTLGTAGFSKVIGNIHENPDLITS